ncbi:MAG: phenylacetate--CoA ligase family protein [Desulfuromonadales bacterium]|nr:phenylacetate--CoA ligase family protein [Desulfuromonadales bacterium]
MHPILVRKVIYPLHEKLMGRDTFACLEELERLQWASPSELEEVRFKKLRDLLIHAGENIPFYVERFKKAGFDPEHMQDIDDIKVLPFLTKAEIKQNIDRMTWKDCPGGLHRYNTGGSSGEPLIFYFDKRRQAYDKAARMLTHRWWGVDVGEKELYLWGSPVEATRQDRMKDLRDRLTNELLISAFEISEARVPEVMTAFEQFKPTCLFGYPSTIDLFGQMAVKQGYSLRDLGVKVVFSTAELLYDHQRQAISEHFGGIPVTDCYGSREGGFVSHECPSGSYHIMDPNYVVEFIKDDQLVAPGEDGEITLTHLDAWGMPLIRYRTGDVARKGGGACSCGRSFGTMQGIRGRTTDFVVTPDGRWQHALSVIYIVRDIEGVDEFKIVQHEVDDVQVLVKIIPGLFPPDGSARIVAGIKKRMGESVRVRVEQVAEVPREASGKHRYVVSKVARRGF